MNKLNYQKILDKKIQEIEKEENVPTLLLHSCCAPCSTYVIEYLANYFNITVYYYNPNIDEQEEYEKRAAEQRELISRMPTKYEVKYVEGEYDVEEYIKKTKHLADEKEGGARCFVCYAMRLRKSVEYASRHTFDYFATTLTISPLKNAAKLNEIGQQLGEKYEVQYLLSDFKKREGYKRSTELSSAYGLYRQNYCGCSYSRNQ